MEEMRNFNRSANRAAKLVALLWVDCLYAIHVAEVIRRVEVSTAHKLEQVSVILFAAVLGHNVHYAAGLLTILGRIVTRLDAEFLQGIGKRERRVDVRVFVNIVAAIEHKSRLVGLRIGRNHNGWKFSSIASSRPRQSALLREFG